MIGQVDFDHAMSDGERLSKREADVAHASYVPASATKMTPTTALDSSSMALTTALSSGSTRRLVGDDGGVVRLGRRWGHPSDASPRLERRRTHGDTARRAMRRRERECTARDRARSSPACRPSRSVEERGRRRGEAKKYSGYNVIRADLAHDLTLAAFFLVVFPLRVVRPSTRALGAAGPTTCARAGRALAASNFRSLLFPLSSLDLLAADPDALATSE